MQEDRAKTPPASAGARPPEKSLAVRRQAASHLLMRGFLIGLSISLAFIVGCVAGSSRFGVPGAQAAAVVEQRWSYFCMAASSVEDVNFKANAAGIRGWELVTSTTERDTGAMVWCFRQLRRSL